MKIETDNLPRKLLCLADLPEQSVADFDYVDSEDFYTPRIVEVDGECYDVHDTMRTSDLSSTFKGWTSYISETFFSGMLFRYSYDEDGEVSVVVGKYSV